MNNDDSLNAFYDQVYEIVETKNRDDWDALIKNALIERQIEWTGDVASTVEIICGGDTDAVDQ